MAVEDDARAVLEHLGGYLVRIRERNPGASVRHARKVTTITDTPEATRRNQG